MNRLVLTQEIHRRLGWLALREAPRECCGVIACQDDLAVRVFPASNIARDPQREFETDFEDLHRAQQECDTRGWRLCASYHSHPTSDAYPSIRDSKQMWPELIHVIIGLGKGLAIRAFATKHGTISEVPVLVRP